MKITVAQFNVVSKALKANYLQMKDLIDQAVSDGFEMVVFGEYALSGYGCADLFKDNDFINQALYYQEKLQKLSKDIIIVYGGLNLQNEQLFNSVIILDKQEVYYSNKANLNKREFNETPYFTVGKNQVVNLNGKNYLFTFKSDLDNLEDFVYDTLIVLDSSAINHYLDHSAYESVVYANTLGVSAIGKVVWINGGNSFINNSKGLYSFKNALDAGLIKELNEIASVSKLEAITYGIKTWSKATFGSDKKWIVGSSGGLDSAVTTALLAIALGSENVITYNLASQYNKKLTIDNAYKLSKKLKVKHVQSNISTLIEQTYKTLIDFGYNKVSDFDRENIQARTRGHLLSAFAAIEDGVISNNGNKMELILGYATIYGDTIGALSSIGDLSKVEVFELADEINAYFNDEIIPLNLLPKVIDYTIEWQMPPSAELKKDQVDPMKWFYHDLLVELIMDYSFEKILTMYAKDQFADKEIGKWLKFYDLDIGQNFIDDFNWFIKTMQINHFKRLQTPPVLAYSNYVLNVDYVEAANILPKSQKYLDLEKMIIEKY